MNNVMIKEKTAKLNNSLTAMLPQIKQSLPSHIKPERLMRIALNAAQNTPKLLECDTRSFCLAVLRAAQLGLEPDGTLGQAYLLPYGDKVQLIIGYKGLIDLARRSGEVSNIIAKEVCANDDFAISWHNEVPFHHNQTAGNNRGEVIGFWAMARFKDGGFHFDYMTVDEVNAIRDNSQGYQSAKKYAKNGVINSPWYSNYVEMGKKTAIRRIAKYLPMSIEKAMRVEELTEQGKNVNIIDGDIIIEHENEIPENTNAVEILQKAAAPAHDEDGVIIEEVAIENQQAAQAVIEPSALTLDMLIALPYGNQTQIKALCKEAVTSIKAGVVTKIDFMQAFPDLPSAADKAGAFAEYKKIQEL